MKSISNRLVLIICSVIFLLTSSLSAQNNKMFEQANMLYNNGNYKQAITKYESILKNGVHSAELYFNLANANYKINNVAPSIYFYEKALQLAPNDKDIKNNMAFAQNMTVDAIEPLPQVGLSKVVNDTVSAFSFDSWAKLTVALMFGFVMLFLLYYFTSASSKKRFAFGGSIFVLLLTFLALAITFKSYNTYKNDKPAIVFVQETEIRAEPNLRSEKAFVLHEGTKVQVLDSVNNWRKIALIDGKTGWVYSKDIKAL